MKIVPSIILILLLICVFGWLNNQPHEVGDDIPQGKLNSLSFAPFWEGQGPMDEIFPTVAQMDSDLQLLGEKTHSIRTYASAEGTLPAIPELARKYGLKMIQGAWLSAVAKKNKIEIDELIRSANANPDVVKRVMVGNEVLLRKDLSAEELINYIREVKKAVKQPVSYADVWSIYLQHPELIKEVDFVTIHILPYWEDEPIPVEVAPAHIERIYKQIQSLVDSISPGKAILIGESGWPSEGRQRGDAIPSVVNAAKFIRSLIKVANANHFDYNIVEATNQSWKSFQEGVVGANWGLFSVNREEVYPLTGKVYENTNWLMHLEFSIATFLLMVAVFWRPLKALPLGQATVVLVLMQVLSVLWINEISLLWYTSYSHLQRLWTILLVAVNATIFGLLIDRSINVLRQQAGNPKCSEWLYKLLLIAIAYATFATASISINGRYISFPIVAVYIPVIGLLSLSLFRYWAQKSWSFNLNKLTDFNGIQPVKFALMAKLLAYSALALLVGETVVFFISTDLISAYPQIGKRLLVSLGFTFGNQQLLIWMACLAVLALPLKASYEKAQA